jgi:uncharacterized protein YndB with AHSA1/START domain
MTEDEQRDATPSERVIDLRVEVTGTPEQVWRAIATGPGISSWYVPTTVEEREGGATTSRFGEGPEMVVPGRVAAWEPPDRIVFTGAEGEPGLVFAWMVEGGGAGGPCVVRLVNSGFVPGTPWYDQYDGLSEGWQLFLHNLQLHLSHFAGQSASAMLPTATWPVPRSQAWTQLTGALGFPSTPAPGSRVTATGDDTPPLSGTVVDVQSWRMSVLLDEPAPGTAFVACERMGDMTAVSVWQYLYGNAAPELVARDQPRWQAWLDGRSSQAS